MSRGAKLRLMERSCTQAWGAMLGMHWWPWSLSLEGPVHGDQGSTGKLAMCVSREQLLLAHAEFNTSAGCIENESNICLFADA